MKKETKPISAHIRKIKTAIFFGLLFTSGSFGESLRFQKLDVTLDPWAEAQIRFWFKVYTEYSTKQSILHDTVDLGRVYAVVDDAKKINETRLSVLSRIQSIYQKNSGRKVVDASLLSEDERKIYEIFEANEDVRAYQFASTGDRIRVQIGQKDRLENAYPISKIYLKRMEEMFEEEGVPKELTRLPFVESGFVKDARSSVGAIGIWQFMPKTAQKDLRVDAAIYERLDPLKSTRAAARFLRQNHRQLHNWSLAVMAYHHGPGLVSKAAKQLKTKDPIKIIRLFKSPSFQFASRNYLFEFLAMLDVDSVHESFFKREAASLPSYITISFPKKMLMKEILAKYGLSESLTKILNPHFKEPVWKNALPLPAHYPVRVTGITLEKFREMSVLK